MKILLIDDDKTLRTIITSVTQEAGHLCIATASPLEGVELAEDPEIDLVLMDVEMPDIDGYEATRRIREKLAERWIPIIFLSAHVDDSSYQRGIDSGGDDYLTKPVSPIVLVAKLRAMERIAKMKAELDQMNAQLRRLSTIDPLTGALNRRGYTPLIESAWRQTAREKVVMSLLLIDIDHFKNYNDTYGHAAGDRCLEQFYNILKEVFRRPLDLIGRYGGEEFVVVLPHTSAVSAQQCAARLIDAMETAEIPHKSSQTAPYVTCSVGIAISSWCESIEEMIEVADQALYRAKLTGRNRSAMPKRHKPKEL